MALVYDEMRQTSDAIRYGFAVGKLRVLEARMLDRAAYERLVDAASFADQMRLLSDSVAGRFLEHAKSAEEVESGLDSALEGYYRFLDEAALPPSFVRFFRTRYDFSNLKAALKAQLLGASNAGLIARHGSVPPEEFSGDLTKLPAPLGPLAASVLSAEDVQVDDVVDAAMFGELHTLAHEAHSPFLAEVAALMTDIGNAKSLLRSARAGSTRARITELIVDGGSIGRAQLLALAGLPAESVAAGLQKHRQFRRLSLEGLLDPAQLDVALDGLLVSVLREGRLGHIGPDPVVAYVLAREAEISTLRMLLLGRLSGVPSETLRMRLRGTYR